MATSILLLPSELKHLIVELSSGSPNSLAALARTHSTYQREAEKALYDTLSIYASSDDSLKCMETLATNSEKAALVHFLTIEYASENINKNRERRVTTYLSKCLINMHSLSDFRVLRSHLDNLGRMRSLSKILCQGHFRLQSFYCHGILNISQVIKSQTDLQIIGLYTPPDSPRDILKTLKELHTAQLFLPIIVILSTGYLSGPVQVTYITIYPAFYSVNRRAAIPQILAQSVCKDQGKFLVAKAENICGLTIYLIDSSDLPSIYALAKDMAVSFPQIASLYLWFEHRCEIPPEEIKEEFSFFPNLREVDTHVWFTI